MYNSFVVYLIKLKYQDNYIKYKKMIKNMTFI